LGICFCGPDEDARGIGNALSLASILGRGLKAGHHYRAVVNLYRELIAHTPQGEMSKFANLRSDYAACLRMAAHETLWDFFEQKDQEENLYKLFRHSSLI
jgi:hypothetical protein